jgi:hypothetical protein
MGQRKHFSKFWASRGSVFYINGNPALFSDRSKQFVEEFSFPQGKKRANTLKAVQFQWVV